MEIKASAGDLLREDGTIRTWVIVELRERLRNHRLIVGCLDPSLGFLPQASFLQIETQPIERQVKKYNYVRGFPFEEVESIPASIKYIPLADIALLTVVTEENAALAAGEIFASTVTDKLFQKIRAKMRRQNESDAIEG